MILSVKVKQRRLQLISVKNLSCLRYTRYRDRHFFGGGVVLKIINPTWVLSQGAYKARWPNYKSWFQPTTNWVTLDQITFWCLSFLIYKLGIITTYLTGLCGIKWVIHGKHLVFIVKPSNEWRFVLQENKSTLLPFFSFEKVTVSGCKLPHRRGIFKIIWWQLSFLVLLLPSQSTALPVHIPRSFLLVMGPPFLAASLLSPHPRLYPQVHPSCPDVFLSHLSIWWKMLKMSFFTEALFELSRRISRLL